MPLDFRRVQQRRQPSPVVLIALVIGFVVALSRDSVGHAASATLPTALIALNANCTSRNSSSSILLPSLNLSAVMATQEAGSNNVSVTYQLNIDCPFISNSGTFVVVWPRVWRSSSGTSSNAFTTSLRYTLDVNITSSIQQLVINASALSIDGQQLDNVSVGIDSLSVTVQSGATVNMTSAPKGEATVVGNDSYVSNSLILIILDDAQSSAPPLRSLMLTVLSNVTLVGSRMMSSNSSGALDVVVPPVMIDIVGGMPSEVLQLDVGGHSMMTATTNGASHQQIVHLADGGILLRVANTTTTTASSSSVTPPIVTVFVVTSQVSLWILHDLNTAVGATSFVDGAHGGSNYTCLVALLVDGNAVTSTSWFPKVNITVTNSEERALPPTNSVGVGHIVVGLTNSTSSDANISSTPLLSVPFTVPVAAILLVSTTNPQPTDRFLLAIDVALVGGVHHILQGGALLQLDNVALAPGSSVFSSSADFVVVEPSQDVLPLLPLSLLSAADGSLADSLAVPITVYAPTAALLWVGDATSNNVDDVATTFAIVNCSVQMGVNSTRAQLWQPSTDDMATTTTNAADIQRGRNAMIRIAGNATSLWIDVSEARAALVQLWGVILGIDGDTVNVHVNYHQGTVTENIFVDRNVTIRHPLAAFATASSATNVTVTLNQLSSGGGGVVRIVSGAFISVNGICQNVSLLAASVATVEVGLAPFHPRGSAVWWLGIASTAALQSRSLRFSCPQSSYVVGFNCSVAVGTAGGGMLMDAANMGGAEVRIESNVVARYMDTGAFPSQRPSSSPFGLFYYGKPLIDNSITSFVVTGLNASLAVTGGSLCLFAGSSGSPFTNVVMSFDSGAEVALSSVTVFRVSMSPATVNCTWVVKGARTSLRIAGPFTWLTSEFGGGTVEKLIMSITDGANVSVNGPTSPFSGIFSATEIRDSQLNLNNGSWLSLDGDFPFWYAATSLKNTTVMSMSASAVAATMSQGALPPYLLITNSARLLYADVNLAAGSGSLDAPNVRFVCDMQGASNLSTPQPPPPYAAAATTLSGPVVVQLQTAGTVAMLFSAPDFMSFVFANGCVTSVVNARIATLYAISTMTLDVTNGSVISGAVTFGGFLIESLGRIDVQLLLRVQNASISLYGSTNLLSINRPNVLQRTNSVVVQVTGVQSVLRFESTNISSSSAPPCGLVAGLNSNLTNATVQLDDVRVTTSGPRVWLISTINIGYVSTSPNGYGWAIHVVLNMRNVMWNGTQCSSNCLVHASAASTRSTTVDVRRSTLLSNVSSSAPTSWIDFGCIPLASSATVRLVDCYVDVVPDLGSGNGSSTPLRLNPSGAAGGSIVVNASVPSILWAISGNVSAAAASHLSASSALSMSVESTIFASTPLFHLTTLPANVSQWFATSATAVFGVTSPVTPYYDGGGGMRRPVWVNMTSCWSNGVFTGLATLPMRMKTDLVDLPTGPVTLQHLIAVDVGDAAMPPPMFGWCSVNFTTSSSSTVTVSRRDVSLTVSALVTETVPIPVFMPPPTITTPLQTSTNAIATTTVASSLVVSSVIPRPAVASALVQLSSSALSCAAAAANAQAAQAALEADSARRNQPVGALVIGPNGEEVDPMSLLDIADDFSSGVADNPLQLRIPLAFLVSSNATILKNSSSATELTFIDWQEGAEHAAGTIVGNMFIVWPLYVVVLLGVTYYRCRHHEALRPEGPMMAGATHCPRVRRRADDSGGGASTDNNNSHQQQRLLSARQDVDDDEETMEMRGAAQGSVAYALIPPVLRPLAGKIQYVGIRANFPGSFVVPYALLVQPTVIAASGLVGRCGESALPGAACFLGLVGLAGCLAPFFVGLYLVMGVCGKSRWGAEWRDAPPFRSAALAKPQRAVAISPCLTDMVHNPRVMITLAQQRWEAWNTQHHEWVQVPSDNDEADENNSRKLSHSSPSAGGKRTEEAEEDSPFPPSATRMSFLARVSLVEAYRPSREWFLFIELGVMIGSGIPIGAAWAAGGNDCDAALWTVFALSTLSFLAVVVLTPYATMIETIWAAIMGALTMAVTLCLIAGDTAAADGIALAQAVSSVLPVLRLIPKVIALCVKGFYGAQGALRRKIRRRQVEAKRQKELERRRRENENLKHAFTNELPPSTKPSELPPTNITRFVTLPPEDTTSNLTDAEMESVLSSSLPTPEASPLPVRSPSTTPKRLPMPQQQQQRQSPSLSAQRQHQSPKNAAGMGGRRQSSSPPQRRASRPGDAKHRHTAQDAAPPLQHQSPRNANSRVRFDLAEPSQPPHQQGGPSATSASTSIVHVPAQATAAPATTIVAQTSELGNDTLVVDASPNVPHHSNESGPPHATTGAALTQEEERDRMLRDIAAIRVRRQHHQLRVDSSTIVVASPAEDSERPDTMSPSPTLTFRDFSAAALMAGRPPRESPLRGSPPSSPPRPLADRAASEVQYHALMLQVLDVWRQNRHRHRTALLSSFTQRQNLRMLLDLLVATRDKERV